MRKIIIALFACFAAVFSALAQNNKYTVIVMVNKPGESVMEFNDWGFSDGEQVEFKTGHEFRFEGTLEKGSYPRAGSLSFVNGPSRRGNQIILEPGVIKVVFDEKGDIHISGTPENEYLDRINKLTKENQTDASSSFYAWQTAYNNNSSKDVLEKLQIKIDKAKSKDRELSLEMIRRNDNFAGLMLLSRVARNETANTLAPFIKQFERFAYSQQYKYILRHYEAMERCTDGAAIRDFTLPDPHGDMVSLSDFRGKWVILDFWYVDCHWCRKLTPNLKEIYMKYKDRLEIISISVDPEKDHQRWIDAIEHDGMTWTQVNDKTKKELPEYFGVTGYPTLFLIDPQGRGITMMVGYRETGSLDRVLDQYVK